MNQRKFFGFFWNGIDGSIWDVLPLFPSYALFIVQVMESVIGVCGCV